VIEFWKWLKQGRAYSAGLIAVVALAVASLSMTLPSMQPGTTAGDTLAGTGAPGSGTTAGSAGQAAAVGTGGTTPGAAVTSVNGTAVGTGTGTGVGSTATTSYADGPVAAVAGTGSPSRNTYQGVTDKTVKWGVSYQTQSCGGLDSQQTAAAYGMAQNPGLGFQVAVKYFNTYPLTTFPLPPEIRAHVNPKEGYWGRHIITVEGNNGGYACPDIGRATATRFAEQDKVFGGVSKGVDGPEVQMSLVMAQHKLIHIGRQGVGPSFIKQRAPYFFDGRWGNGTTENYALGSWVCRDWVGKNASDTGDALVTGKPRVFGITYDDVQDGKTMADVISSEVARCGLHPKQYAFPADLQTAESNAESQIARMRQDGITTILNQNSILSRLFLTQAATKQKYNPEWVMSGYGNGSYPLAYSTFMTPDQAKNSWAAADMASLVFPRYDKLPAYLAWKKIMPNQEPPSDFNTIYDQMFLLAVGMAGAGPNLTPQTFAAGLTKLCAACPRKSKLEQLSLMGPGPANYTTRYGFTLIKYNPNKDDIMDPPDQTGKLKKGYFDFIEGGKRYGLRITDPDNFR
jgi:hypothetical protein